VGDSIGARNATSSRKPGSEHHGGTTLTDWLWINEERGFANPQFVEWLMGFPLGWTDCAVSETPSSPKSSS
jgi:hypothetical protein